MVQKKPTHREGFLILSPLYLLIYIGVTKNHRNP